MICFADQLTGFYTSRKLVLYGPMVKRPNQDMTICVIWYYLWKIPMEEFFSRFLNSTSGTKFCQAWHICDVASAISFKLYSNIVLGNQASDADSTDSEDENPLNHAGIWTLEEVLTICKEKMVRLRSLYAQQFKRMNHHLKEERRRYVTEFDMDPFMLSKVPFYRKTG